MISLTADFTLREFATGTIVTLLLYVTLPVAIIAYAVGTLSKRSRRKNVLATGDVEKKDKETGPAE
jgi:hypothetical protein